MMCAKNKLSVIAVSLMIMVSSLFNFDVNAHASTSIKETANVNDNVVMDFYKENSEYFDTSENGDETVVTITDDKLIKYFNDLGIDTSKFSNDSTSMLRRQSNGVTKLVWHGKASKGNEDVYISASTFSILGGAGTGVATRFILMLLPPQFKLAAAAIDGAIGAIGFSDYARVFVVRGFRYQYNYLQ
ncbi:hypothetical protein ACQV2X_07795 [Facklamia sp. P12945]